jgi:CHAT domain-containing protein/Flp pilus assembly protein TadD
MMPLENELLSQGVEKLQSGDYGAALELFDKVLAQNPQQPNAWYQKGLALQKLGRYVEAVVVNEQFMALTGNLEKVDKIAENLNDSLLLVIAQQENLTQEWLQQGELQILLGNFENALKSYDEALECKSDCLEAWFNRGFVLRKLHRLEEAISNYNKILQFQPEHWRSWYDRGIALCSLKHYEEGAFSFERALELKPNFYQAWYGRGLALHDLGCNEEAISSYNEALKINSDFYQAWVNRGNALGNIGRHEEAIASYDKALELNPSFHTAWYNRGQAVLSSPVYSRLSASIVGATLSQHNPQLNQRGYSGQIITLEFGLTQVAPPSEGWGYLQYTLGEAHFEQGKREESQGHNPSPYRQKARHCLELALSVLSEDTFPHLRLQTLELMIRVLLAQGDTAATQTHRKAGGTLLLTLLNQAPTSLQKQHLEAEFSGFSQIAVDVWLQAKEPITALETAERDKNRCLTWILEAWQETVIFPSYAKMQTLCTPDTAVVYWHLSPDSLTTFVFTDENALPQVLEGNNTSQFQQFTTLMQDWHKDYQDYASQKFTGTEGENHPWQKNLVSRLGKLQQKILQIEAITQKLPDTVKTLILVPHRDLHLLSLHALFPDRLSCVYLPSLQIGLNLSQKTRANNTYTPLLSIEDPATERPPMHFAQLESAIIQLLVKNATCISRDDAATDIVTNNLHKSFSTFHFTGHGAYNSRTPSDSGLALTDGLLTAKEISQLDLSSYKLIVLASCETALTGNEDIKTEYVGLASAFLKAGAANVLSTLWPVDEISSAWLMIRFYQFLLTGDTPSMALRQAQCWLQTVTWQQLADWIAQLSQLPNLDPGSIDILTPRAKNTLKEGTIMGLDKPTKYSHPYYWAAFIMTGQG